MKRASNGFTIVELMIAMAIFMIICAIAIPNYMSATQRAHEAVAVSFLRQLQTGQEAYRLNNQQYADTFAKLQPYVSADLSNPSFPTPGLGDVFITTVYAEPIPNPPQGNSGSAPGQGGSNPGNGGNPPGQGGSNPGNGGNPPGQGGSNPGNGGSNPGQGGSGSGGGSTGSGSATSDSKVYSMYIFQLTLTDPQHWSCTAEPVRDRLNSKFYYTDQSNVIRFSVGSLADSLSPQI
jgi:prepilin-type N-terminal cleavage/methylation domain-containing protein